MSARPPANADRGNTSVIPACLAASIKSTCTCDTKPIVGIAASAASLFIDASVSMGSVRGLLRSKMTADGRWRRISSSADADDRANVIRTPSWFAVVLIFDVNMRSSRTARIIR